MSDIRIGPGLQALAVLGLIGGAAAGFVATLPEIKRYLNMREM